ncbi:Uncharacterised protein [Burkholderia pseudomallei]|nr:Uncharacterised protein [Burkholderia pseudomallei]
MGVSRRQMSAPERSAGHKALTSRDDLKRCASMKSTRRNMLGRVTRATTRDSHASIAVPVFRSVGRAIGAPVRPAILESHRSLRLRAKNGRSSDDSIQPRVQAGTSIKLHLGKDLFAIESQSQRASLSTPHQKPTGFTKPLSIAQKNPRNAASRILDSLMRRAETPADMRHRRAGGEQALQLVACLPSEKAAGIPCRDESVQPCRQAVNKRVEVCGARRQGCIHHAGFMQAIRVSSLNAGRRSYLKSRTAFRRQWIKSVSRPPA